MAASGAEKTSDPGRAPLMATAALLIRNAYSAGSERPSSDCQRSWKRVASGTLPARDASARSSSRSAVRFWSSGGGVVKVTASQGSPPAPRIAAAASPAGSCGSTRHLMKR